MSNLQNPRNDDPSHQIKNYSLSENMKNDRHQLDKIIKDNINESDQIMGNNKNQPNGNIEDKVVQPFRKESDISL